MADLATLANLAWMVNLVNQDFLDKRAIEEMMVFLEEMVKMDFQVREGHQEMMEDLVTLGKMVTQVVKVSRVHQDSQVEMD